MRFQQAYHAAGQDLADARQEIELVGDEDECKAPSADLDKLPADE